LISKISIYLEEFIFIKLSKRLSLFVRHKSSFSFSRLNHRT
jgi:hypothetical protein